MNVSGRAARFDPVFFHRSARGPGNLLEISPPSSKDSAGRTAAFLIPIKKDLESHDPFLKVSTVLITARVLQVYSPKTRTRGLIKEMGVYRDK